MNDRDLQQALAGLLAEPRVVPDDFGEVLARLPVTPQRRGWWPSRRPAGSRCCPASPPSRSPACSSRPSSGSSGAPAMTPRPCVRRLPLRARPPRPPPRRTRTHRTRRRSRSPGTVAMPDGGRQHRGEIDDRKAFRVERPVKFASAGAYLTERSVQLSWQEHGVEMWLHLYLRADDEDWWIEEVRSYDGRKNGDWIYYRPADLPQMTRMPRGATFEGDLDLASTSADRHALDKAGRVRITGLRLTAFAPGSGRAARALRPSGRDRARVGGEPDGRRAAARRPRPVADGPRELQAVLSEQGVCHTYRLHYPTKTKTRDDGSLVPTGWRTERWCTLPDVPTRVYLVSYDPTGSCWLICGRTRSWRRARPRSSAGVAPPTPARWRIHSRCRPSTSEDRRVAPARPVTAGLAVCPGAHDPVH